MSFPRLINITARGLSSSSAAASSSTIPRTAIPAIHTPLPPVLERHIQRHLLSPSPTLSGSGSGSGSTTSTTTTSTNVVVPNPFIITRSSPGGPIRPRSISRRREKQLRDWLPGELASGLPPSALSTLASTSTLTTSIPVTLPTGETAQVSWETDETTQGLEKGRRDIYAGRRLKFKGHKHERERPERERETKERMQGMEKRIAEWKKNKADAASTAKPSLPF